jgi:hypothetical protein
MTRLLPLPRGYTKQTTTEHQRWRTLDSLPNFSLPDVYKLDIVNADAILPARSWASWRAFHPDEPDEKYQGWEWYFNVQRAPLYRRDLDLVARVSIGDIAAFVTVWWDEGAKTGTFEPVGTHATYESAGFTTYDRSELWGKIW